MLYFSISYVVMLKDQPFKHDFIVDEMFECKWINLKVFVCCFANCYFLIALFLHNGFIVLVVAIFMLLLNVIINNFGHILIKKSCVW